MTLLEIIFGSAFTVTFLCLGLYILFVQKPAEPEKPSLDFPKEFTIRIVHEAAPPIEKPLSAEDKEFLKKQDEKALMAYKDLNERINERLDELGGKPYEE